MVLKGACLYFGASQCSQTCLQPSCHSCVGASGTATAQACHCSRLACCGRLACCSRLVRCCGALGSSTGAGAVGRGSCCCTSPGSLPCFTVCPRTTTISAISLLGLSTFLLFHQEVEFILAWLLESGDAESFLVFLTLFTFLSFPMTWGYILVNIVAGYRFGPLFGTFVVAVAVAIGSAFAFLVCRTLLSSWIRRSLMTERLEMIVGVVESSHGFQVIALTRLTPIPFGIQNGVFALAKVKLSTFVSASSIGLLPTQFLNCYMGSSLRSVQDIKQQQSPSLFLIAQVFLSFLLSVYVLRLAQRELQHRLHRHCPEKATLPEPQCRAGPSVESQPACHQHTESLSAIKTTTDSGHSIPHEVYIV